MKNQLLLLLFFVSSLGTAMAQNKADTVIYTKDKVINIFGNTWRYYQNEDDKWVLEIEEDDEVKLRIDTHPKEENSMSILILNWVST